MPEDIGRINLMTLQQWNKYATEKNKETMERAHLAKVACDKCEVEMHYVDPYIILDSFPPCKDVVCPQCGHRGYKTVG